MGGLCGWGFILFEIFAGEAAQASETAGEQIKSSYGIMRIIVSAGWSIYPLGYLFGYLMSSVDDSTLNLIYNLADFVNKISVSRFGNAPRWTRRTDLWACLESLGNFRIFMLF